MLFAWVFLLGGLIGAACDQIHVLTHTLSYPHPTLFGQPWWVAPQFGLGTVGMLLGGVPFAKASARTMPPPPASDLATGGAWLFTLYLASGFLGEWPGALLAAYLVLLGVRLAARADRLPLLGYALLLGAAGVAYEGTVSATGAFAYARPGAYHVPIWLPGLYMHGAPLGITLARRFVLRAPAKSPASATAPS